jgi:hypothetical protein
MNAERRLFTTAQGIQIPIKPIHGKILDDLALQWSEIENMEPPTYTVTLAGGDTQEVPHDPTTLQTKEDHEAWNAYQTRLDQAIVEYNEAATKLHITLGIDEEPPDSGWEEDFAFCGVSVPETPRERKVFYYEQVALADPVDMRLFVQKIFIISRLSGEALDRADALFRHTIQRQRGMDSAEGPADQSGEVATQ